MRQGPQIKRQRGRGQGGGGYQGGNQSNGGGGNNNRKPGSMRHQTFDSNGPDTRVRGTAIQVYEKYMSLARDATSSGDRVMAENYYQHAEHYYRIIASFSDGQPYIPQHMQQRDAFDFEQDDERGAMPGDDGAVDPSAGDVPQPDLAANDGPRFDERRDTDRRPDRTNERGDRTDGRREFRDRRGERDGFRNDSRADHRTDARPENRPENRNEFRPENRPDNRSENRPDLGEYNEQPAFLRQPTRRPRDEQDLRDDRREDRREPRRFEGDNRVETRGRPRAPAYSQGGFDTPAPYEQPNPVTVITPAGGGLPPLTPPDPVPVTAPVVAPAVETPAPVIVPIAEVTPVADPVPPPAVEAALPLDLPTAEAEAPAEPPKRKRGRPPKVKPPVEA